jgi:hypothetical protein
MQATNITTKTNLHSLVYRVEDVDYCYLVAVPWEEENSCSREHQDPCRARRSRFAGALIRRNLIRGRIAWIPYEVERKRIAHRMGNLLKTRMFDTCYRWPAESLPVSPASMAKDYLGCSLSALVEKFEHQFEDGMTWDNFGARGWVIDHILPVSRFDFRKISHVRRACHYRNLRPCWEAENIRKGNRLVPC